ncbi:MAG: ferritin family protein [Deltaproteobacteria bacterium]|nr:ferritin family protein [Deltaproteobacteria bacterium]
MGFAFSADEIFALAEKIEKNGAEFYRRAAANAACSDARHLLLDIAGMEDGHQGLFARMRRELAETQRFSDTFDPEGETAHYLAGLANSRVFSDPEDPLPVESNSCSHDLLRKILEFAMGREKDSIAFYRAMKELVETDEGKCRIDDIIREEESHIRMLKNEISLLDQQ